MLNMFHRKVVEFFEGKVRITRILTVRNTDIIKKADGSSAWDVFMKDLG